MKKIWQYLLTTSWLVLVFFSAYKTRVLISLKEEDQSNALTTIGFFLLLAWILYVYNAGLKTSFREQEFLSKNGGINLMAMFIPLWVYIFFLLIFFSV